MYRNSLDIYRDLVRLVHHIGARTKKGRLILDTVRAEFRKHRNETDPSRIHDLQQNAGRALSNYLLLDGLKKLKKKKGATNVQTGLQRADARTTFGFEMEEFEEKIRAVFEERKADQEELPGLDAAWAMTSALDWAGEQTEEESQVEAEMFGDRLLAFAAQQEESVKGKNLDKEDIFAYINTDIPEPEPVPDGAIDVEAMEALANAKPKKRRLTFADLNKLTKQQIRQELLWYDVPAAGRKEDLVVRLALKLNIEIPPDMVPDPPPLPKVA